MRTDGRPPAPEIVLIFAFALSTGNRDYTGMWVRRGSTNLMADKVVFLRGLLSPIRVVDLMEGTTDRRGRSHPPQCTTSCEDRQIGRMTMTDRSVTSRTIAQHIESVSHHSVSARTSKRRLQQSGLSARRPLLGLPLTKNHRHLRYPWCDERRM
ncbi:transposable element Tcb1 transposase [Trichonephila clavipes]|nr:transposable element Tcb1 transposase [Trichonephila clavipes]